MPTTGPAVTIPGAGTTTAVPAALAPGQRLAGIRLKNLSRYALIAAYGTSTDWIAPFTAVALPQTQLAPMALTAVDVGLGPGAGTVLPTYYYQGEPIPPDSLLAQPTAGPQNLPGSPFVVAATTTGAPSFTIPQGLKALAIAIQDASHLPRNDALVSVVGNQSGINYTPGATRLGDVFVIVPVFPGPDTTVTVTVTAGGSNLTVDVVGLFDFGAGGTPGPELLTVRFDSLLTAGATSVLIAGAAGKTITLIGYRFSAAPVTANTGNYRPQLQDTFGTVIDGAPINYGSVAGVLAGPPVVGPAGPPLKINPPLGIQLANPGAPVGGSVQMTGTLYAVQA